MSAPRRPARAEVVGSLLRPPRLLEARAAGDAALEEIVDAEVRAAVAAPGRPRPRRRHRRRVRARRLHPLLLRRDRGHRAQPRAGALPQRRRRQGPLQRRAAHLRAPAQGRQPAGARHRSPALDHRAPVQGHAAGRLVVPARRLLREGRHRPLLRLPRRAAGGHAGHPARAHRRGDRRRRALRAARLPQLRPAHRRGRARARDPPPGRSTPPTSSRRPSSSTAA